MNPNPSRRSLRHVFNAFIALGALIAVSPALQHAYGWWSQRQLMAQWEASSRSSQSPQQDGHTKPPARAHVASSVSKIPAPGGKGEHKHEGAASAVTMSQEDEQPQAKSAPLPPTRLSIPEIGVDAIVVQGVDAKALARGPGHDPGSALPGENGNCVLAAHRNIYGSWFYNMDQLWAGSTVKLISRGQTFRYSVVEVRTVSEADTSVARSQPGMPPTLTLITCTLPHSPFRLVAIAYLQNS